MCRISKWTIEGNEFERKKEKYISVTVLCVHKKHGFLACDLVHKHDAIFAN
jgi:hypothetical protein